MSIGSRTGRFLAGIVLLGAVGGLALVISSASEQRSWASTEGVVQERLKSGKSVSVKVEFPAPDGTKHTEVLSENGPARHPGDRVTVRYDVENGKVVEAALADNDQAHWVAGVILGVVLLGALFANLVAWLSRPVKD